MYTKGKWEARQDRQGNWQIETRDAQTVISKVTWPPKPPFQAALANAHLIAASPELYEACKFALKTINIWRFHFLV